MNAQSTAHAHIDITETLVRLYVFLAQNLDRCLNEAVRTSYPEHELRSQRVLHQNKKVILGLGSSTTPFTI